MYVFIWKIILDNYLEVLVEGVLILYGGSVKFSNVVEIFGKFDVDGGLIGGVLLNVLDFVVIIKVMM